MSSLPRLRQGACPPPPPANFAVASAATGSDHLLALRGEVDIATVWTLAQAIDRAERTGAHDVVVDVAALTFVDSCAVQELLGFKERLEQRGGSLLVVGPGSAPVRRVLDLCGLGEAATQV